MALTVPQTPAAPFEALPPLVITICPDCNGEGGDEDYDGTPIRCETCSGYGASEVCSECGVKPTVKNGLDSCGCACCELCERTAPLNTANICETCHLNGVRELEQEADEYTVWISQQLELGREFGWLA